MGLEMSLFKINKRVGTQAKLKDTVKEIEDFDYAKRHIQKLQKINTILNKYPNDIVSAINELEANRLIGDGSIIKDGVTAYPKNDLEYLENCTNKILYYQNLYIKYLERSLSKEKASEIKKITNWVKYYNLDNHFERLFKQKDKGKKFRGTPLLLSKEELEDTLEVFKYNNYDHKDKIINSLSRILEETDFKNETIYYQCW